MERIWTERITLAEGYDEQRRDLVARAWHDDDTGTLRIELGVLQSGPDGPPLPVGDDAPIFDTVHSRTQAIRRVIAAIDAGLAAARPAAEAWAAECLARAEAREIADLLIPDLDD